MSGFDFVGDVSKTLNRLAREQTKEKLLKDILIDMKICQLEGWDYREYLLELRVELRELINDILSVHNPK